MAYQAARQAVCRCATSKRYLSTTPSRNASPLFALGALSNSRETQHFAKESRLSHVEHSPNLQLIQSSEVLPFARPKPTARLEPALPRIQQKLSPPQRIAVADGPKEADLLSVGRAILLEKDEQISKLKRILEEEKDRASKRETTYALARTKSRDRISRLQGEVSSEKLWKWTFLFLGASSCAWLYASDKGQISYSLGEARPVQAAAPIPKPVHAISDARPAPLVVQPASSSTPLVPLVKEIPKSPQQSLVSRLFWSS